MKTIKAVILIAWAFFVASFLSACAGLEIVTHTPYGSAGYRDGVVTAAPIIHIPIHRDK